MALPNANKPPSAVVDASLVVGFCAREADKYGNAKARLEFYALNGWQLFAPGVLTGEVIYVLCAKLQKGEITQAEHDQAVQDFTDLMAVVNPPPRGEASLVLRAEQIRLSYGCSRANDSFYLALAEQLRVDGEAEVATFDSGMKNQAQSNSPTVAIELLPFINP